MARIKMADGSTITVVSSSSADVVGAGEDGTRVRTDDTKLNIRPVGPPASPTLTLPPTPIVMLA